MTIKQLKQQIKGLSDDFEILIEVYQENKVYDLQKGCLIDTEEKTITLGTNEQN